MEDRIETTIPGREPIELVSFYDQFRDYYPQCELQTKRWFVDNIQSDWWIFDVGANIGYYTILFAQLAHRGRVLAFEPTTTAAMLRQNLQHNRIGNAEVHEIALGATTGRHEDKIFRIWGSEGELKTYPFYRLDDFIDERQPERVDCIKIDVDSYDFEVLRGAERTLLERDPVVVVELNHALAKRSQSAGEALAWLAGRGYRNALVLDHDNFVLQRSPRLVSQSRNSGTLELSFAEPLRMDERMSPSAGTAAGSPFVDFATLANGALLRSPDANPGTPIADHAPKPESRWRRLLGKRPELSAPPSPLALEDILDAPIETSDARWNYALTLHLHEQPQAGSLTVQVGVEVVAGQLGIALGSRDSSRFASPERTLSMMPGSQFIVIKASSKEADLLIFRNVAPDGTRTMFRITSLEARFRPTD